MAEEYSTIHVYSDDSTIIVAGKLLEQNERGIIVQETAALTGEKGDRVYIPMARVFKAVFKK